MPLYIDTDIKMTINKSKLLHCRLTASLIDGVPASWKVVNFYDLLRT